MMPKRLPGSRKCPGSRWRRQVYLPSGFPTPPWKNVETGCWMQDARYACPRSGGYPAATFSKSMKQIRKRADELVLIAAAIGPWTLLVVAVLIIGTLKCCLTTDSDSIDESINKSPGIVAHVMVLDSTDNGFRVVYATAAPVTDERFAEIWEKSLQEALQDQIFYNFSIFQMIILC